MHLKSFSEDLAIPEITLSQHMFNRISKYGDKVSMIDLTNDKSITYKELQDQASKCASALDKEGLRRGDVVAILADNCIEFPIIMLAILACGATITTVNPAYTRGEVIQQFEISEPCMVFTSTEALETIKTVAKELKCIQKIFSIGKSEGLISFDQMVQQGDIKDFPQRINVNVKEDVAILPYSSGTTGLPKSVMLTHYNVIAYAMISAHEWQANSSSRIYSDRPMFHMGGIGSILVNMELGSTLILDKQFEAKRMLEAIQTYKVTHTALVPPLMIILSQNPLVEKYDTSSLEEIACGGASVAPQLIATIAKLFNVRVVQGYGMTECGVIAMTSQKNLSTTSVGKTPANTTVKIVDLQTGDELGVNENGEICVQGPQVMKGYMKNPEATSVAIDKEGWLHTGDIGYFDKDQLLYVVDRLKEVIKYKTFQVPPAELESVLLKHPKIADVGVIGIPDALAGEIPKAFVVKKDESLSTDEVRQFVQERLADYKSLRGGVEFTAAIPKSVSGKIQRIELKKMAAASKS